VKNNAGKTPGDLAREAGRGEVAALLAEAEKQQKPPPERPTDEVAWVKQMLEKHGPGEKRGLLVHCATHGLAAGARYLIKEQGQSPLFQSTTTGDTPLHLAAENGHADVVAVLLQAGAPAARPNKAGRTARAVAQAAGHDECVVLLADAERKERTDGGDSHEQPDAPGERVLAELKAFLKANPDADKNSALAGAIEADSPQAVLYLLELGANPQVGHQDTHDTYLHLAARLNRLQIARILIEAGTPAGRRNKAGQTPADAARQAGHDEMARLLTEAAAVFSPAAATTGPARPAPEPDPFRDRREEAAAMADLKDHLADMPSAEKHKRAFQAASRGWAQPLTMLLDAGVPVEAATPDGRTLLMLAMFSRKDDAAELLLQRGAKVAPASRQGQTALHFAADLGMVHVVERLLDSGADVDAADGSGQTPLHRAAERGDDGMIGLLLAKGAKPDAARKDGQRPLHRAVACGCRKGVALLLAHGASPDLALPSGAAPRDLDPELARLLKDLAARKGPPPQTTRPADSHARPG